MCGRILVVDTLRAQAAVRIAHWSKTTHLLVHWSEDCKSQWGCLSGRKFPHMHIFLPIQFIDMRVLAQPCPLKEVPEQFIAIPIWQKMSNKEVAWEDGKERSRHHDWSHYSNMPIPPSTTWGQKWPLLNQDTHLSPHPNTFFLSLKYLVRYFRYL